MQYVDMFHALQTGTDKNGQIVCCCDRLSYIDILNALKSDWKVIILYPLR